MAENDRTTAAELNLLAQDLEERAGITPPATLRRDPGTPALVRRIRDAVDAILGGTGAIGDSFPITFSVQDPENVRTHAGRGTKSFGAWLNTTGRTFRVSRVTAIADTDDYSFSLFVSASKTDLSLANDALITTLVCSANGTSVFSDEETSFFNDSVLPNQWIIWEHASGTAESTTVVIEGVLE